MQVCVHTKTSIPCSTDPANARTTRVQVGRVTKSDSTLIVSTSTALKSLSSSITRQQKKVQLVGVGLANPFPIAVSLHPLDCDTDHVVPLRYTLLSLPPGSILNLQPASVLAVCSRQKWLQARCGWLFQTYSQPQLVCYFSTR
jgi:hypothetical protein